MDSREETRISLLCCNTIFDIVTMRNGAAALTGLSREVMDGRGDWEYDFSLYFKSNLTQFAAPRRHCLLTINYNVLCIITALVILVWLHFVFEELYLALSWERIQTVMYHKVATSIKAVHYSTYSNITEHLLVEYNFKLFDSVRAPQSQFTLVVMIKSMHFIHPRTQLPQVYYCHYCVRLHPWRKSWFRCCRGCWYEGVWEPGPHGCPRDNWFPGCCRVRNALPSHTHHDGPHFYGDAHGVPVKWLERSIRLWGLSHVRITGRQRARIIEDQLLISTSLNIWQSKGDSLRLRNYFDGYGFRLCYHVNFSRVNTLAGGNSPSEHFPATMISGVRVIDV